MCANEVFLTPAELAERWKVTPQSLQMLRSRNRGPRYVKVEKRVRYSLIDVQAYEDERTHAPGSSRG